MWEPGDKADLCILERGTARWPPAPFHEERENKKKQELSSLQAIKEQLMKSPATENRQKHRKKSLQSLPEQPWHGQGALAGVYLVPVISSFPAARRRAALPWQCQGELGEGRARDFLNKEGSSTEATVQSKRQSGAAK